MRCPLAVPAFLCLSLCLWCALGARAQARPYAIEDMLRLEGYGQVLVAADGVRVLVDRQGPYETAARFDYGYHTRRAASRVMTTDMRAGAPLALAFPQEPRAGYWTGSFAPTGPLATVFRLKDGKLRLGVAEIGRHVVRWFAGAPDLPLAAPTPVWRDASHILYLRFAVERLPFVLDHPGIVQRTLPARWERAAAGRVPSADIATTRGASTRDPREERLLVELDVSSGRERVLARGPFSDFLVAPSGKRVALLESGERVQPDPGTAIGFDYVRERHRLLLVDLVTGQIDAPCASCDVAPRPLGFAPTGAFLMRARRDGDSWANARLIAVDSAGGALADLGAAADAARPAWLGGALLLGGKDGHWSCRSCAGALEAALDRLPPSAALVASDGARVWFEAQGGLWRLDASGALARILEGKTAASGLDYLDSTSVGSRALGAPTTPIVRVGADRVAFGDGAAPLRILDYPAGAAILAASPKTGTAIALSTDAHGVGSLLLLAPGAPPRLLDRISRHLADVELPEARSIVRRGADGTRLVDWLILPKARGPHPLVVIPYQGEVFGNALPNEARPQYFGAATNVMLLTASGYAVLLPSLPQGPKSAPQSTLVADIDQALDAAIATGLVDPARIAVEGHSYGGMNALYLAAHSRRFRAVIAQSGMSEMAAGYGTLPPAERVTMGGALPLEGGIAWFESGQGEFDVAPWQDPARYQAASPFFSADRISAPLLLVAGDIDYAPMEQAERLYVSLDRLGRDVTLVRYFGEGHVIQSPANIRQQWQAVLAFLARTMPRARPAR